MRQKNQRITEHLALLSIKQGVFVSELFEALLLARENRKSICQALTVEFRGDIAKQAVFLITKEYSVVGQFKVPEFLLLEKNICFDKWMNSDRVRRKIGKQRLETLVTEVQDLRQGMKKVNLRAEVLETSSPTRVCTRFGNSATVTHTLIADGTGSVKLCLWNDQESLVKRGDTVQIENASVLMYKGERQLHLGKKGTLNVLSSMS